MDKFTLQNMGFKSYLNSVPKKTEKTEKTEKNERFEMGAGTKSALIKYLDRAIDSSIWTPKMNSLGSEYLATP